MSQMLYKSRKTCLLAFCPEPNRGGKFNWCGMSCLTQRCAIAFQDIWSNLQCPQVSSTSSTLQQGHHQRNIPLVGKPTSSEVADPPGSRSLSCPHCTVIPSLAKQRSNLQTESQQVSFLLPLVESPLESWLAASWKCPCPGVRWPGVPRWQCGFLKT